jgi:hypothetical protein
MHSIFWILLALTVSTALGQITFEMNAKGLTSLMYGGRNWIGKYERETYIYENNTIISRVLSKTLYSPNEARWAYSWGSINLQVTVDNATSTAYLTLVVNNTLGALVLTSIRGDLATISYPTNIAQYNGNNVLLNTNIGGKTKLVYDITFESFCLVIITRSHVLFSKKPAEDLADTDFQIVHYQF